MHVKLVDASKMKDLEGYVTALVTGLLSLKTLESFHVRAVDIGILKEDLDCRANTLIWDLRRLMKLYTDQAAAVMELLPEGYDYGTIIAGLAAAELAAARKLVRGKKVSKKKDLQADNIRGEARDRGIEKSES